MENIEIPEGVFEIGLAAFYGCNYAEDIVIASTVQRIGNNAFALCDQVKRLEVRAFIPPTIEAKTFYKVDRNIDFVVPAGSQKGYAEHEYWSEFIREVQTDVVDNKGDNVVVYTQDGVLYIKGWNLDYLLFDTTGRLIYTGRDAQLSLPRGVYLLNVGDKTYKVAM